MSSLILSLLRGTADGWMLDTATVDYDATVQARHIFRLASMTEKPIPVGREGDSVLRSKGHKFNGHTSSGYRTNGNLTNGHTSNAHSQDTLHGTPNLNI